MHRIDALSCTRMGIETFSATARAPGIWKVYAPPLHVRFPGMKGSLWCARGHTVKGLYPKLLATPTSIATTHTLGSLASTRAAIPGVRKNPFFTLNVNVL